MKISYRPEIDGLRAIAVIAVLIYHLKIPFGTGVLMQGGFLGVDLFFVLSGFLITKILLGELEQSGQIDFRGFYIRRARRILPPLVLVMLVSLPFAWAILLPSELERFGQSLLAALFFFSNVFWYQSLGEYGAQSGLLQPFLHTWSLAIEEQFYLVFPIALLVVLRMGGWRGVRLGLWALLLISLALAHLSTLWRPDLSFFSPVSRAWELLAGSVLAYASMRQTPSMSELRLTRALPSIATVVLLWSLLTFDLEAAHHPGLPTIPVILASCALLWFARPGEPVTQLLSTRPFVLVGKLSYSLYLWHFPVFAFGRLFSVGGITVWDQLSWVTLTVALSIAGYYLIERPFRFRLPLRSFIGATSAAVLVVVVFGAGARFAPDLGGSRLAGLDMLYGANSYDNEALQDISWTLLDALAPDEKIERWNAHDPSQNELSRNWFSDAAGKKVLIAGNSHGKDLFNAVALNAQAFPGVEFARFALKSAIPQGQFDALLASPNFQASDLVVLATKYNAATLSRLPGAIKTLQDHGKDVLIIGNTAEFQSPSNLPLFDWYLRQTGDAADLARLNTVAYDYQKTDIHLLNQSVQQIAHAAGAEYLSRQDLVCQDAAETCILVTPEGRKTMYDFAHWTLEGAAYFGQVAAQNDWFAGKAN